MSTDPVTIPADEERLVPISGTGSLLDRWVAADPDAAIKRIEAMTRILESLRAASIRATHPSDWICHVSRDQDGAVLSQRCYLQDMGAERAAQPWGIDMGAPVIERQPQSGNNEDGTFMYVMLADAWSKVTGARVENVQGSRWSGDPFFAKSNGPDDKVDPSDVLKAAYANLHGRAVRALAGLNGIPLDTLKAAGIDVSKVVMVDYTKGGKGGESTGAGVGTADVVMAFGKQKGMRASELADADLAWYVGAAEKSLADPSKASFHKAEQRRLDALKREQEQRTRKAEHEAATGKEEAPAANGERIKAQEVTAFWSLAKRHGWEKAETDSLLLEIGAATVDQIPMAGWETIRATLERGPVRA